MTSRFTDHLLTGTHAARPLATAVPTGTLYSCTTDNLIYKGDGSVWSTWATFPAGGGSSRPTGTSTRIPLAAWSTASTTFVDVAPTAPVEAGFTKVSGATDLLVVASISTYKASTGGLITLGVRVAGVDYPISSTFAPVGVAIVLAGTVQIPAVAAGAVTARLRAKTATGTMDGDGINNSASVTLQEV